MKQKIRLWAAMGVVCLFALQLNAEVCPDTISQGGLNKSGTTYTLHDSVGGIGGAAVAGASHQVAAGYIPQVLCGCNCLPCDAFLDAACAELATLGITSFDEMLDLLAQHLAGTDLSKVDICGDGTPGGGCPEACAAFITQTFQDATQ